MVFLFRHAWVSADSEFERALKISPLEVGTLGGYGPYLLSRGHYEDARGLARQYMDEGFDEPVLLVRAGLYLYALREYEEAQDALQCALALDEHFWRAHLIVAFVMMAIGNPEAALTHMKQVEPFAKANLWPGFLVLCLEHCGHSNQAQEIFDGLMNIKDKRYVQPMQLALANMALGNFDEAILYLDAACDESDPFTAWLHLWPLLDPLRRFPAFRALLRKWQFPTA